MARARTPSSPSGLPVASVALGPGLRLTVVRTDRFTTTYCRVVLQRDLSADTTATAVLAPVLRSATARHPSREALAHRLADLYGASLGVGVEKLGDRGLFSASLEWPTAGLPGAGRLLGQGLGLLREVLTAPKRGPGGGLDPDIVATEHVNQVRAIRALKDEKGRYAVRRALAEACAGEPFALDVEGDETEVARATPDVLAALHGRLLAHAPAEIFLVGDLGLREAVAAVRTHLLWAGRGTPWRLPPAVSVRAARTRPLRLREREPLSQAKLVLVLRGALPRGRGATAAARTLAGVLGGGPYARLFKVVRETHGLCYSCGASWVDPKGLLLLTAGIDPPHEVRARRLMLDLSREVAGGALEPTALQGFREAAAHRVASLRDSRGALVAWLLEASTLGLDPDPRRLLDDLAAVRPADVRAVGRRLALDTQYLLGPDLRRAHGPRARGVTPPRRPAARARSRRS